MSGTPDTDQRQKECASPDNSTGTETLIVEHPEKLTKQPPPKDKRAFIDRILQGYTCFMDSGLNQDRGLKLLQWTLWMFSYALKDRVLIRDALKKLYNELSFARYAIRLLGLPPALEAARSGSWATSSDKYKGLHKFLGQILAWSMIGYYPLEHGAYVQWQTPKLFFPKGPPNRLAEKLSAWSCRFWTVYIVAEILQSWMKLREENQKLKAYEESKKTDEEPVLGEDGTIIVPPKPSALRNLRLQIVRDLLFALPAVHWSLPNWDTQPWLPDPLVNTLMWLESVVCMYQSVAKFNDS